MAGRQARAGHDGAAAGAALVARVRGALLRPRRGSCDGRLRAGVPGERADALVAAARARAGGPRAACVRHPRSAACGGGAADPQGRARGDPLPRGSGRGRDRAAAARVRRARRPAARGAADARRRRAGPAAPSAGGTGRAIRRSAPLRVDRAPGARDRRDRCRSGARPADAAPAPGRRRVGEDRGGAVRPPAGGGGGPAGGLDGADRDARRAALRHRREPLLGARRPAGAPDRERGRQEGAGGDRVGRGSDRRGDACADPAGRAVRRPRGRGSGRAAPVRRRAAPGALRTTAARAAHDGDPDPAHARAHGLRRARRHRDREAAGEPQAGHHGLGGRGALQRGVCAATCPSRRRPAGVRGVPADRGLRDAGRPRGRGRGRAAPAGGAGRLPGRAAARAAEGGGAPGGDAGVQGAASSTCWWRRR